jgi:Spy/CpxP family protein refolding chaperone
MKKMMMMLAAVVALSLSANLSAQDQQGQNRGDRGAGWMEKMKAARVAFLTNELDLSASEAEAFWPVYNQAQEEKDAAFKETREAYRALTAAIKDGKGDKEVSALLKAYLKASKVPAQLDEEYLPEFLKVLPATKVAKLYISEEKFRKMQFQNMQGPRGEGGAGVHEGGRPGGREGGFRGPGQGGRPGGREGGFRGPGFGRQSENTNE